MLKEKISDFIETIKAVDGIKFCALVSRDGIMLGKYAEGDFNEAWFAAMCATISASAESVSVIIKVQSPEIITLQSQDGVLLIMGAGDKILIAALIDSEKDILQMTSIMKNIADEVGGSF